MSRRVLVAFFVGVLAVVLAPAAVAVEPGAAVSLLVTTSATAVAGTPLTVTVTAVDATGATATGYGGTVALTTDDPRGPVLPAAYSFTTADAGVHAFVGLVLHTAGTRLVTATDQAGLAGSASLRVATGPATVLQLEAPSRVSAGVPFTVRVAAKDAWTNLVTSYRGTVGLTSTDPKAVLPAPWTFTASDAGSRDLPVTLVTAPSALITATDPALTSRSIVGVAVQPGPVVTLAVQAPAEVTTGVRFPLTVTARDVFGNAVPTYAGTVALGSTDTGAGGWFTPSQYRFVAADAGTVTFSGVRGVVLANPGTRTITVRDLAASTLVGTATLTARLPAGHALYTWGANDFGELGIGSTTASHSPVRVGTEATWARVSVGGHHTVAIKSDGTLWAWGLNTDGELGDGTRNPHPTPVRIGSTSQWAWVSAGPSHTLALKRDGTLWGWGRNWTGQLGNGTTTSRLSPVRIGTGTHWVMVSAGAQYTLGLQSDGTMWAWGDNTHGVLGDGTFTQHLSPTRVGTEARWVSASAGGLHNVAIRSDSTLWAWGSNAYGQLGDGTLNDRSRPLQIAPTRLWFAASAGGVSSLGLGGYHPAARSVFAWGRNDVGQLGDGTTTNRLTPTYLPRNAWWQASVLVAGDQDGFVVTTGGALVGWGKNYFGEVGDGTTTMAPTPVRIGTSNRWVDVTTDFSHSAGLRD
ncbi:RCC1 domain-containing protein [Cellulomonas sp. P5_C6]